MGLVLGLDGKDRAMQAAAGLPVSSLGTLYLGLLQAAPSNMDGMDLATLISGGGADEFAIDAGFYTGRKAFSFGLITVNSSGAITSNSLAISWNNTSGSPKSVLGLFITDASSGNVGNVLFVGTPDVGSSYILNGQPALLDANQMVLKVD